MNSDLKQAMQQREKIDNENLPLLGVHVLLVESDEPTLEMYSKLLQHAGAVIECIDNVCMFLRRAENDHIHDSTTRRPDVVLVNLILPDDSGLTVIKQCQHAWPCVPVLAFSTFPKVDDAVEALQSGASHFIRKPVHLADLVVEIDKALKQIEFLTHHRRVLDSLRILNLARSLASIPDRKELLKAFLRALSGELRISEGFAFLYDADLTFPEFLLDLRQGGVSRREPFEFVQNLIVPVLAEKRTSMQQGPCYTSTISVSPNISISLDQRFAIIDFQTKSGNRGIVAFSSKDRQGGDLLADLSPLAPLIEQTGCSFQNLDTFASMLLTDELTGLYNQKFMYVSLQQELSRCQRYGGNVSLMFIDLDHFKLINDLHGHLVGSEMIRTAAVILKKSVRDSDFLLRYGGDEFCTILPDTQLEGALILAERIRSSFERSVLDLSLATGVESATALNVTTSIGVASFPEFADSTTDLVKAADAAMYESKRSGRNRVTAFRRGPSRI